MGSGYSGNASFDFEIERYKNKLTGEFLTGDKAEAEVKDHPFGDEWFEMNYEYQVISLSIEGSSYFQPGRLHGHPDNCYPDEGDTEITSVIGPDGLDWESNLTESEKDSVIEMIQDHVVDGMDEPDYDDYDDRGGDFYDD